MGANIGTTITAWLITILGFKVSMSAIALPLVGFGFLFMFSKKENLKNWGGFYHRLCHSLYWVAISKGSHAQYQ